MKSILKNNLHVIRYKFKLKRIYKFLIVIIVQHKFVLQYNNLDNDIIEELFASEI